MRTPDWKLERYLLGELEPQERERIDAEVESDETVRERLEALRRSSREILERYPAPWMARQIRDRVERGKDTRATERGGVLSFLSRPLVPAGALAVLLIVLVVWPQTVQRNGEDPGSPGVSTERIKGETALQIHRKTADSSERLDDGALVQEGDLVLIRYKPAGWTHGAILSIDGRGTITRHLPTAGDTAAALPKEGVVSLDFAYELDDAPVGERFFFVTSPASFDLEPIIQAAREATAALSEPGLPEALDLDEEFDQATFTLSKESDHE